MQRPRTWVMVRRSAYPSHDRGEQTSLLRTFGRDLHSTYGPERRHRRPASAAPAKAH